MNPNESEELLLLIGKSTDPLIEQTKRRRKETLKLKLKRSEQTFSFKVALEVEEEKCMMGVTN